ncbi:MAG: hypothetical protein R8K20_05425 [Gallionellaceae bacterium]
MGQYRYSGHLPQHPLRRSTLCGLATVDAPSGAVIAFATAPGKIAADSNGMFTNN